jgi:hypothetical protein
MTRNYAVKYEGRTVAHLQVKADGLLLTPGSLSGNKLAELGLTLENRDLPEGFTLKEVRVSEQRLERKKPNWKEVARQAWEQRKGKQGKTT